MLEAAVRTSQGDGMTSHASGDIALRCSGLVKRYRDVVAVGGIELAVRHGECFGLLGPNGAGKTTTVEIFEGLTRPDAGEVVLLGQRWGTGADRAMRQCLGVALQETELADKLTVAETVRLFRSFYRCGRPVDEVIASIALGDKRRARVGKLSGGQKQRLALACALVADPEVLFLDEPTTGLDPQARHNVWEIVERFRAGGGTVLLTTHYMEEAARLCDRVAIIDHGILIAQGTPRELVASLGADQVVEIDVDGELAADVWAALSGVSGVDRRDGGWTLSVRDAAAVLPAVVEVVAVGGVQMRGLRTHQATLEDVFVRLTGRGLRDA